MFFKHAANRSEHCDRCGTLNHAAITRPLYTNNIIMKYNGNNSIITPCSAPKMRHQKYYANTMPINTGVDPNAMLTVNSFFREDFFRMFP